MGVRVETAVSQNPAECRYRARFSLVTLRSRVLYPSAFITTDSKHTPVPHTQKREH